MVKKAQAFAITAIVLSGLTLFSIITLHKVLDPYTITKLSKNQVQSK